ncbi:NAD(P)/FAD-dependent oxidoreductase [Schinkia azotoformans]|uniref:NAD(P)/FAD-dependent oxidoreductase n=1 Tax=Schinkia azotoformans TaxID=1454 RepID=UPI002DBB0C4E|nr:FAD-dependent oxidoreductase [Schinkia azotoformans]MEC1715907.1 FAD-dependent oxidoreductase [Schinkia azotoformans]MEC1741546.1 FAD-dependent oxidoreductase [Schinkia azotoformans]MEC1744540.1 FAD-dependent oxidoreductase [Schinkia azotoformans]MEC1758469.1 FAD-dependent oxidoreductase [Schinkia azotoformans]MEC1765271.1 FAD-dependent oxidoreductase [Schinkia azotoformans]
MANVVILGAGFAGQTAALYLRKKLTKDHQVTVINPWPRFTYIPSLVWVGVGQMQPEKTMFELAPILKKKGIKFIQAWAREIHPDEQYVVTESKDGTKQTVNYDYLINATGPHLNFEGTEGLGPDNGYSHSICNIHHAKMARDAYLDKVERMKKGEHVNILIGTGHGQATCQGAALEYITNIHSDLVKRGLRDKAKIMWISNEPALGDLGVGGIHAQKYGYVMKSEAFLKSLFAEQGIYFQVQTAVKKVEQGKVTWENYEGEEGETEFDFAMLIPQFLGTKIKYINKNGEDITSKLTNPGGFMLVDGGYGKQWNEMKASDWPSTYQSPFYPNIFAAGIAFAPPGSISKPRVTKNGTVITATAPRTGMAAGIIGRVVAFNIIDMIEGKAPSHYESMSEMPGACIASLGKSIWNGSASTILMYPVAPDYEKYPEYGRDLKVCDLEVGLAGAWIKRSLHTAFLYKMKGNLGWSMIPE